MEYHSNSENLFRKYSNWPGIVKPAVKKQDDQSPAEIVEYTQRYKAEEPVSSIPNEPSKQTKVIVHIGGMQHMISAPDHDGEAYIRAVAEKADRIVESIRENNPGMAMTNVLILALLNAVDQLNRSEKNRLELSAHAEEITERMDVCKDDYLKQREINWELKKEVLRLRDMARARDNEEQTNDVSVDEAKLPLEELLFVFETEEQDDDS